MFLKKLTAVVGLVLLLIASVSFAAVETTTNLPIQRINKMAKFFMRRNNVPGMAIDIYYKGKPYYLTYGIAQEHRRTPVTQNTIFEIDSITKSFTATILAMEVLQGQIKLIDKIGPYVPEEIHGNNLPIDQATFEQLATHTASLPDDPSNFRGGLRAHYTMRDFWDFFRSWKPSYPMGTKYLYSDTGYGILAYALAGVEKIHYRALLRQQLLNPLGMSSTTMFVSQENQMEYARGEAQSGRLTQHWKMEPWKPGAGALRSTPIDMMKYLEANLDIGPAPENIKQAMMFAQKSYFKVHPNMLQGLAWVRSKFRGLAIIYKDGGDPGFSSFITFPANHQFGVVVMVNKGNAKVGRFSKFLLKRLQKWS